MGTIMSMPMGPLVIAYDIIILHSIFHMEVMKKHRGELGDLLWARWEDTEDGLAK